MKELFTYDLLVGLGRFFTDANIYKFSGRREVSQPFSLFSLGGFFIWMICFSISKLVFDNSQLFCESPQGNLWSAISIALTCQQNYVFGVILLVFGTAGITVGRSVISVEKLVVFMNGLFLIVIVASLTIMLTKVPIGQDDVAQKISEMLPPTRKSQLDGTIVLSASRYHSALSTLSVLMALLVLSRKKMVQVVRLAWSILMAKVSSEKNHQGKRARQFGHAVARDFVYPATLYLLLGTLLFKAVYFDIGQS